MKRIYEVDFEEKWKGCDWVEERITVLGNGDALKALSKVKKHVLSQSYVDDDTGKLQKCIGFRFLGVKVIAEAEL